MLTNSPLWIKRIRTASVAIMVTTPIVVAFVALLNTDRRCGEEIIQDWYHNHTVEDKDAWRLSVALTNDPTLIRSPNRLKAFLNNEPL